MTRAFCSQSIVLSTVLEGQRYAEIVETGNVVGGDLDLVAIWTYQHQQTPPTLLQWRDDAAKRPPSKSNVSNMHLMDWNQAITLLYTVRPKQKVCHEILSTVDGKEANRRAKG